MAGKREKPEDIVLKLRQVEVLQGQGKSVQEAVRPIHQNHHRGGDLLPLYPAWLPE